jgi:putative methyltransferase (TIGR04325 family)
MIVIKRFLKIIIPHRVLDFFSGFFYGWSGNFQSWDEALKNSDGYDSPDILKLVRSSALKVRDGEFNYERNSVLFSRIQYSFPLLAGLMWIAARNKGCNNILDFGGSLGSSYFQNRKFLESLADINWCIVEQPALVKCGIDDFQNGNLHFFYSVQDCINTYNINVCVLSSVLQYLEKPYEKLDEIIATGVRFIIIDRTPFVKGKNRITIQKVHPAIYKAKYPCWFFDESEFRNYMDLNFNCILEFEALDKANIRSEFKGFIFERK